MNLTNFLKKYHKCISCKTIQKTTFVFYSDECAFYIDIKESILKINKNLIQLTDSDGEDYTVLRIDFKCPLCFSKLESKSIEYTSTKVMENFDVDNYNFYMEDFVISKFRNGEKIKIAKISNIENGFWIDQFNISNKKELEKMLTKAKIYFAFS
jgi:hypothetical protein